MLPLNAKIQITGEDASELIQLMTPRNLSKSIKGKCYYCPIVDDNGYD